ncbi:hypothetical protein SAMN02745126_05480 [Enhydrobacter aerosaccus]|uniref:Uncharacterized protein n=1 Tax=Enhydrobacter aerosaccus TaxID=225324 RepID=A0A1T4T0U2_9HYPH|nr:hypothetical protein [Enhydrobacter aerosaccus]SKA34120.1 hypothetical protein SAMN02745126_05480 [Enhydrobacter aerosaccus]
MALPASDLPFCGDGELGYDARRTTFVDGAGLSLDEAYRLAHLPLVAPRHPGVIARKAGTPYEFGRHEPVVSLVLPVPADLLHGADAYRALEADLKAAPFAHKIAWDIVERRRDKLHATLCGSLASGQKLPATGVDRRAALARLGGISVELRGLFSGTINRGRLYLRVYPERRDGIDVLRQVQRLMGCRETGFYVVGLFNLVDDLDPREAAALAHLIDVWWNRPILRYRSDGLWLLSARDDLVLDADILELIPLT